MEKQRKIRSDKKRDIKPTIPCELKEAIYRLSHITNTPVKLLGEKMCQYGFSNKRILDCLSPKFKRDIRIDNTFYRGDCARSSITKRTRNGECERITLRFRSQDYELINALAYAMDCTVARACAVLLELIFSDIDFIDAYVKEYLEDNLNRKQMNELKKVMNYINKINYRDNNEGHSWASLLSHIVDEVKAPVENAQEIVNDFVVNYWKGK